MHRYRVSSFCGAIAYCLFSITTSNAHHPDRETQPPRQRIDVIGPLGNRLPASYRRVYNRPTNLGGKIAYWIAPSSQEAMAWHQAQHAGLYDNGGPLKAPCPRVENLYFYPKPWEALQVGQRRSKTAEAGSTPLTPQSTPVDDALSDEGLSSPVFAEPMISQPGDTSGLVSPADVLELERELAR